MQARKRRVQAEAFAQGQGAVRLAVEITAMSATELALIPGRVVWASVKATEVRVTAA